MSSILQSGTIIENRYRVVQLIGKGGMGAVYEAVDQRFNSTVALKQMFLDPNLDPKQAAMVENAFKREAQTLHHLRHASLPRVSDYFLDPNGHFLVMDYIQGNDLAKWLENRMRSTGKPFTEHEVLPWMKQVLMALEYLHEQTPPVIHRDIKPHNIKVTNQGQVYLLDFGISKGVSSMTAMLGTGKSSIYAYTLGYAPLEQIQGTGTGPRSDLFSLGATMYHMLTGTALDDNPRLDALTRAQATLQKQPDPLVPPPGVSDRVCTVLMQSLALVPDERPDSATAMLQALESNQPAVTGATVPVSPPPAPTSPPHKVTPKTPPAPIPPPPTPTPPPTPDPQTQIHNWRFGALVILIILALVWVMMLTGGEGTEVFSEINSGLST
jgi:serine/threonine protein kinase